jgi:UDP-4-amino-4,6-dideoxy-N-acetyl-beta-L-altrosamine N-acetyltransferase
MTADDLEMVFVWRNHPEISRHMLTQHSISLAEHKQWFERVSQSPSKQLLVYEQGGTPMGFVSFTGAAPEGVADWGFYAAPNAPKGTGLKLGRAALNYVFNAIGLHKICGQVVASNDASIHMHRKLGFREEGVLREQHKVGAGYVSLICFGLLHDEWLSQLTE